VRRSGRLGIKYNHDAELRHLTGQSGNPISITGPFDGDSSNTSQSRRAAKVIAESPRNVIIEPQAPSSGRAKSP